MHLLSCIHNSSWNGSRIVINSSFQPLVIHNITCTHLNAFMQCITHLHLYLCNQSHTPFICIRSMHDYKIHKIFSMHIHSMLPCIDSGILCIQHTMHGLTMTTSYRMHYYNQYHDTFLYSNIHMVWGLLPVPIHGICHKQTLTCMGRTYTLNMTNLVGPLQEIAEFAHQLLSWTCCLIPFFIGLLVTFINNSNIFS